MGSPTAKTNLFRVLIFVLSSGLLLVAETLPPVSFNVKARIEPAAGTIAVQATIDIPLAAKPQDFQFRLYETFVIRRLLVDGKEASFSERAIEPSPMTPAAKAVTVTLPPVLSRDRIQLDIAYQGQLKDIPEFGTFPDQKLAQDDQINSRMVELAGYSSWYPVFASEESVQLQQLELSLPQGWTSICSGEKLDEQIKDGRAITRWSAPPDLEIVIVASPNFKKKTVRQSGVNIEVYYTQVPEEFIAQEGRQIADVIKFDTDHLGETSIPGGTVRHVYSPKHKGQGRADFARAGLIVTSEGRTLDSLAQDPKFSLFQSIAHEIGHFWWNFGAGQGDWINEAFAEYFSAVAVQKISSEQEFRSVLADYRKQVGELPAAAPSLSEVPLLNDQSDFVIRYYKGSLMLNSLRETLGDEQFFQACRDFFQLYQGKPTGTTEFRSFWDNKMGDRKNALDAWLDSKGGLPGREQKREGY